MKGSIKKLVRDRGFGFISAEDGREIFFHTTALQGLTFDSLIEGQSVEFDVEKSPKDSRSKGPRAINVQAEKQN
ncbi:MAG TPA: cold shock domain-containing protein [Thermodesulfobacteriota bacterium]|nr:cold shock domain-containing protein [Thermodesulfobacteriota bacterium]